VPGLGVGRGRVTVARPDLGSSRGRAHSRFALSVRVSLPLMLAVVGILPLVIWLADLLPPLAGMA
jgi:hypothetical protein